MALADDPVRVGISSCLLGNHVRYDGGHKRDDGVLCSIAPRVELVPVCPEVELGLGTPREPIHLVAGAGGIRLLSVHTRRDHTDAMYAYARKKAAQLAELGLSGYIFKARSPSCGLFDVPIHKEGSPPEGRGLFAAVLTTLLPAMPVEEEGHLHDALLREQFLEKVLAYHRLAASSAEP